ncbi:unnamed protein product [Darwinula stevensoni]|uniref:Homeobox domain-containing protein n=1 Tax=Darwinula stevensoni TaxID=69355 RepID=A0A7R9A299_9CRUS|nr:unnamed protein product [Darwinula stevensoni]CAG0879072.1 unnamed protein product [Darwinula stevensoni]
MLDSPYQTSPNSSPMLSILDRQNLMLGNPQLAALHSMADVKAAYAQAQQAFKCPTTTSAATTPHSIDQILGRGSMGASLPLMAVPPRLSVGSTAASMYLNPAAAAAAAAASLAGKGGTLAELATRHGVYWPGLQGMLQNPSVWRERLGLSAFSPGGHGLTDKDGKKKHTRPTFSGQQIFALEKTFEQTKYLAGPERAKLAYALGMTESQVKVWFQNRRTKWRKKHAAEMASAKRKQEEAADKFLSSPSAEGRGGGGSSVEDEDEFSDSASKRRKIHGGDPDGSGGNPRSKECEALHLHPRIISPRLLQYSVMEAAVAAELLPTDELLKASETFPLKHTVSLKQETSVHVVQVNMAIRCKHHMAMPDHKTQASMAI